MCSCLLLREWERRSWWGEGGEWRGEGMDREAERKGVTGWTLDEQMKGAADPGWRSSYAPKAWQCVWTWRSHSWLRPQSLLPWGLLATPLEERAATCLPGRLEDVPLSEGAWSGHSTLQPPHNGCFSWGPFNNDGCNPRKCVWIIAFQTEGKLECIQFHPLTLWMQKTQTMFYCSVLGVMLKVSEELHKRELLVIMTHCTENLQQKVTYWSLRYSTPASDSTLPNWTANVSTTEIKMSFWVCTRHTFIHTAHAHNHTIPSHTMHTHNKHICAHM